MLMGCPGAAGAGGGGGVTITSSRNHTVHSTAPFARMENISLRQTGSSGRSCLSAQPVRKWPSWLAPLA